MDMPSFLARISTVFIAVLFAGCATVQQPIAFSLKPNSDIRVGIIKTEPVEAQAHYTGQIGLLDFAIISAANSSLNAHLKSQDFTAPYKTLPVDLSKTLESQGFKATIINQDIDLKTAAKLKDPTKDINKNDFSKYKNEHNLSHLMVLRLTSVGTTRGYYGPVPLSEPSAETVIKAVLVDLNTNKVDWYATANSTKLIQKPWDESSKKFPNLTNAVFSSTEDAAKLIKTGLSNPSLTATK